MNFRAVILASLMLGFVPSVVPGSALATCAGYPGGNAFCNVKKPGPWTVSACDDFSGTFTARRIAWCTARGGSWNGSDCVGAGPVTDDNAASLSLAFAVALYGPNAGCAFGSDTGYHTTYVTNNCTGGADEYSDDGQLSGTYRTIVIPCVTQRTETIRVAKTRTIADCPPGTTPFHDVYAGIRCERPQDPPTCGTGNSNGNTNGNSNGNSGGGCAQGNPITPGSGSKVETFTDYRHSSGLEFTRYYHSLLFADGATTDRGGVQAEGRLGRVWRTNFDWRIVHAHPADVLTNIRYMRSGPDGTAQYFDLNGVEQWNLGRPSGSLVVVSGVGFYYKRPDSTEFYGTDGRLQTITTRSGQVLTLTYGNDFVYDAAGNPTTVSLNANVLRSVSDAYGNTLTFNYGFNEKIVKMTDPAGGVYRYVYDSPNENLVSVIYPDTKHIDYLYNEPANMNGASIDYALTGIIDENGVRYATFKYDASGHAVSTEHAGGAGLHALVYNADGSRTVTDPLGAVRTLGLVNTDGVARFTSSSLQGGAGPSAGIKAQTFDTAGNLASKTDFNDIKTCYAYLAGRNLETTRVEGLPAATTCSAVLVPGATLPAGSRKIVSEWHARWDVPTRTSEPGRRTTYAYNGDAGATCAPVDALIVDGTSSVPINVTCTKTIQATTDLADGGLGFSAPLTGTPRTWTYTYNVHGKVLTVDGPRTDVADVTTYAYYADDDSDAAKRGNLATITNAASHTTQITSYNAHGQPLSSVDANGLVTAFTYDQRRRLKTRDVGGEITSYDYDDAGQLTKVTLPDTSFLSYSYDGAHRLTGMQDNLGNRSAYTLDAMGNRTQEQVFDPGNTLAQTRSRVYSSLNRLFQELGALNQTTEYGYDNQGNVTSVKDPNNHTTANQYDALNRLKQVTQPGTVITQYAYNGLDALTQVIDPRGLATGYTVDGLGNLALQSSPDTGNTSKTYDDAGNLLTQTDAKSQVTTYVYDALNRVTLITFHDGSKQAYAYDQGTNGIGRLSSITETDPANAQTSLIQYAYDQHGRVDTQTHTFAGTSYVVGYDYDAFGRLGGMTYPSGRTVTYGFDSVGRVNAVSTTKGGTTTPVVQDVQYQPFGGVKSFTLGNGQTYTRTYDLDGRVASYTLGGANYVVAYDDGSRITGIGTNVYGYDDLDRLTSAVIGSSSYSYSYDGVGNRQTKTVGASTDTYAYSPTSNRLASITPATGPVKNFVFDPNGSTTNDAVNTYVYDTRGRMVQSTSGIGTTTYQVNALGQRVRKTNSGGDTLFHYDARGRLIAEFDPGGTVKREILYLGDIPVGVVQ